MNNYEVNPTHTTESVLPIKALLALIEEQQETGYIRADLSSIQIKKRTIKGIFRAQVDFQQGQRSSCTIFTRDERKTLLQGEEAWITLQCLQNVTWLITFRRRPDASLSVPQKKDPIPVRLVDPTQERMFLLDRMFSGMNNRRYRTTFLLVDGRRSTKVIAKLLSMDQADVENVLSELATHSFIYFS